MLRTQGLALEEPPAVFKLKRLHLLIKGIKHTLVIAGMRGFENGRPNDIMGCNTQRVIVSPAAPC